jgi:glucose-1-phosphate thymidylyltransferase
MKALILAAGYATRLQPLTADRPKALLRVGDRTILGHLLEALSTRPEFDAILLVTNHRFAGTFRRWLAENPSPAGKVRVLDDGTESEECRLGAIGDLAFAIEGEEIDDDLYVMAGDNLPMFDPMDLVPFFLEKRATCIFACREADADRIRRSGSVAFEEATGRVTSFVEKPLEPLGPWRVPPFYLFPADVLPLVETYLDEDGDPDAPGSLIQWLHERRPVYVRTEPEGTWDIGTPESYREACRRLDSKPEGL